MSLQFPCPCGRLLQVDEELASKRVRCPSCSRIVWAPAAAESVPEARLVDSPKAPKIEPVAARQVAPEPPPFAAPPEAEAPSPAPAAASCGAGRHDCGASAGFILSLGSLVFGVVAAPLFLASWPVGGAVGALVSCGALRRIRSGRGNPASAGLARAGVAIGVGQALLGVVLFVMLAPVLFKSGVFRCCPGKERLSTPSQTIVIPAPERESKRVQKAEPHDCETHEAEEH